MIDRLAGDNLEKDAETIENSQAQDTSAWRVFGPMDQISLGTLTTELSLANAEYVIEIHKDEVEAYQESQKNQPINAYPTFSGMKNFYYIKIPLKNCLIVKKDLEKLGFKLYEDESEFEFVVEYICPLCENVTDKEGFCASDGSRLLEFSDWAAYKSKGAYRRDSYFLKVVAFVVVGILILMQF